MTTWYDTVWSEALWFPKSVLGIKYGWKDLENDPSSNIYLPQPSDLHWSLIIGLGLVILRYFLERLVIFNVSGYHMMYTAVYTHPVYSTLYSLHSKDLLSNDLIILLSIFTCNIKNIYMYRRPTSY